MHATSTFFHACTDYHPLLGKRNDYFAPDSATGLPASLPAVDAARPRSDSVSAPDVRDVISVVVPCFTESGRSLQKTLYDLWLMQEFMHRNKTYFHFHVCIILDGWSKAPPSLQAYIRQLFESEEEQESVRFSTLQKEMQQAEQSAAYPDEPSPPRKKLSSTEVSSSSGSDASSDSDSSDDVEATARRDRRTHERNNKSGMRDVKFDSSLSNRLNPSVQKPGAYVPSRSPPSEDPFLFPESVSFSGMSHPDRNVQSKTKSWERYISNWSADSDLNPPTQPETLIVQKWTSTTDGHHRSVKPVPIFPGLDEMQLDGTSTVPSDPEEMRRKKRAAMKMTVIIKRDNRRKHNSHEWFLTAFAPVYTTRLRIDSISPTDGIQFVFMTDGTHTRTRSDKTSRGSQRRSESEPVERPQLWRTVPWSDLRCVDAPAASESSRHPFPRELRAEPGAAQSAVSDHGRVLGPPARHDARHAERGRAARRQAVDQLPASAAL